MKLLVVNFGAESNVADKICSSLNAQVLEVEYHRFPDGESYVRLLSPCQGSRVIILSNLHNPDEKILQLYFLCETLREMGADTVELIAPYLPYMRQDIRFKQGEAITSRYFSKWVSQFVDRLITIDPHLHRYESLNEIYSVETQLLHASDTISDWIKLNIENPIIIGPDSESEQWVSAVAHRTDCPFIVLEKIRKGDRDVEVSVPNAQRYLHYTPVLVDDIISTGKTMLQTSAHLEREGMRKPVCVGVHAVCSESDYKKLADGYVEMIVSCNTIPHSSNKIDIIPLMVNCL